MVRIRIRILATGGIVVSEYRVIKILYTQQDAIYKAPLFLLASLLLWQRGAESIETSGNLLLPCCSLAMDVSSGSTILA
jgi:formate hydrogenlyase subunit 3/multisubunit Na+/H+ antiporter MnhD subunit